MSTEILLSIIAWIVQLTAVLIIPVGFLIWAFIGKKSNSKKLVSLIISIAILLCVIYCTLNPVIYCPSEYEELFTPEIKDTIQKYNKGIYSYKIPVIPVFVYVEYIDEECIKTTTYYYIAGNTQMVIEPDGAYMTKGIWI